MIELLDEKYEAFLDEFKKAIDFFRDWNASKKIRLISHFDADGITSASIIIKTLERENRLYSIDIVEQLDQKLIKSFAEENFEYIIITDLGGGQYDLIKKYFKDKKVIILDHHTPTKQAFEDWNNQKNTNTSLIHINPHFFNIDGGTEISGAGVSYFFAKKLNNENSDLSYLAFIGAVGDVQIKEEIKTLNKKILEDSLNQNLIDIEKTLNLYGIHSRPLHKLIVYNKTGFIPGVSGDESSVIRFLNQLGIPTQKKGKYVKFNDLTKEEKQRLIAGIIIKRVNEKNPNNIFSDSYILKNYGDDFVLKDVREFATVLNACGRLNKPALGINLCLKNKDYMKNVSKIQSEYRRQIVKGINWAKNEESILFKTDRYSIIKLNETIPHTIAGTIASILTKSNDFPDNYIILSIAETPYDTIKASIRIVGNKETINLKELMKKIIETIGEGESGGHNNAAGAVIPINLKDKFIEQAKRILDEI